MARSWYAFIPGGDPTDIERYWKASVKHSCLCGTQICAIYAKGIGITPDVPLSPNMQKYIKNALLTGQLQPETPVGCKKYVYLKIP